VRGREDPDLDGELRAVGYELRHKPDKTTRIDRRKIRRRARGSGAQLKNDAGRLLIASVPSGSPAEGAGVYAGDEIIGVDGFRVVRRESAWRPSGSQTTGASARLLVFRRDEERHIDVTLGAKAADLGNRAPPGCRRERGAPRPRLARRGMTMKRMLCGALLLIAAGCDKPAPSPPPTSRWPPRDCRPSTRTRPPGPRRPAKPRDLPAGHPPKADEGGCRAAAGHPPLSAEGGAGLPAGHPPTADEGGAGMPAGHRRSRLIRAPRPSTARSTWRGVARPGQAGDTIYLIARAIDDQGAVERTPIAVERLQVGSWPQSFHLSPPAGAVQITARIDKDGEAMTRNEGDIEGTAKATAPAKGVQILLDTPVHP